MALRVLILSGHEELCMLFKIQFDESVPGDYAIDSHIKITNLHSRWKKCSDVLLGRYNYLLTVY